jgi:hypothetical protein
MMNILDTRFGSDDSKNPKQYFCECERGYKINNRGRCQKDINECETGTHVCENNSKCKNKKPRKHNGFGYQCKCNPENYQGTNPDPTFIKKGVCDGVHNDCENSPCGDVANTCVDGTRVAKNKKSLYLCLCRRLRTKNQQPRRIDLFPEKSVRREHRIRTLSKQWCLLVGRKFQRIHLRLPNWLARSNMFR